MDSHVPFLPRDIITNILKRLPVKFPIRFRCVCKDWKNLLKTPSFISAHLHHSQNQNPFLLFTRFNGDHTLFDLLDCSMQQLVEVQNVPVIEWVRDRLVSSCNGLLCFRIDPSLTSPPSFLLWNPAASEVRQVPGPLTDFDGLFFVGFGFNPILYDYQIVINYGTHFSREVKRVEVYSLSVGSWKEIEFDENLLEGISLRLESITVNGVIFWLASKQMMKGDDGDDDAHMIVSFNIAMEVFALIQIPVSDSPRLTVYEGKPALLVSTASENFKSFIDLWVMEEETGLSSKGMWTWNKKYTSDVFPCILSPLTIWRSQIVCNVVKPDELFPGTNREGMKDEPATFLYLFNLTTNELKMFPTGRLFPDDDIFNYCESLEPLDNRQVEEP
ncbi:putative F-box protein At5g62660 [Neltuma alba]|uniref:putative F-box protein At5g62660 n=1 Tax=Neltuma alba TaxID=207710 RepID=UPI0010A3FE31|nr:putative F-box protein At5g62660 [Prosopis alba]